MISALFIAQHICEKLNASEFIIMKTFLEIARNQEVKKENTREILCDFFCVVYVAKLRFVLNNSLLGSFLNDLQRVFETL